MKVSQSEVSGQNRGKPTPEYPIAQKLVYPTEEGNSNPSLCPMQMEYLKLGSHIPNEFAIHQQLRGLFRIVPWIIMKRLIFILYRY